MCVYVCAGLPTPSLPQVPQIDVHEAKGLGWILAKALLVSSQVCACIWVGALGWAGERACGGGWHGVALSCFSLSDSCLCPCLSSLSFVSVAVTVAVSFCIAVCTSTSGSHAVGVWWEHGAGGNIPHMGSAAGQHQRPPLLYLPSPSFQSLLNICKMYRLLD